MSKIVNLYKLYGNDSVALVNPAENPGILQVRTRSAEKRHLNKQMGIASSHDFSQANLAAANRPFSNYNDRSGDLLNQGLPQADPQDLERSQASMDKKI